MRKAVDRASALLIAVAYIAGLCLLWAFAIPSTRHLGAVDVSSTRHVALYLVLSYLLIWALAFSLSNAPRPRLRACFFSTSIIVCLMLGSFELLSLLPVVDFRTVFATPAFDPRLNPYNVLDPELLYIRKPYVTVTQVKTQGGTSFLWCLPPASPPSILTYHADGHGFRNTTDLSSADIALIGDSMIEWEVPADQLVSSVLAHRLGVTVANLGQSGYGPQQELVVLKRYGVPLRPRVIVWLFFEGNDLDDVHQYEARRAEWGSGFPGGSSARDRSFLRNSLGAVFRLVERCQPSPLAARRFGVLQGADGRSERMYFWWPGRPLSRRDSAALDRISSVLSEAYDVSRRAGITFVVAFVPEKFRVYAEISRFPPDSERPDWIINDLPQRLQRILAGISPEIGFLDLTPALIWKARTGDIVYMLDDVHWTVDGHRTAAEAIQAFLEHRLRLRESQLGERPESAGLSSRVRDAVAR